MDTVQSDEHVQSSVSCTVRTSLNKILQTLLDPYLQQKLITCSFIKFYWNLLHFFFFFLNILIK